MSAIILDLDNCIADDRWRRSLIDLTANTTHDRYHQYHSKSIFDPIGNTYLLRTPHEIIICTTRAETYRFLTEDWLLKQSIFPRAVLMRAIEDHRPTAMVKGMLVTEFLAKAYLPLSYIACAYDDREDVIAQYRGMGLRAERVFIAPQDGHGL